MTGPLPGTQKVFGGNGISGIALLMGLAGFVLIESGLRNKSIRDVISEYLNGKITDTPLATATPLSPVPGSGAGNTAGGAVTGAAVADDAKKYVGVPYVWAGSDPSGWDCSGFVTWVLHHDFGIDLPDNTHTVTGQFYVWSGAATVPRSQMQAGDLVCWLGHIGIAIDNTNMVNAPGVGVGTVIQAVYDIPAPVIRRPLAYYSSTAAHQAGSAA